MGKEYELKYAATPAKLAAIARETGGFHSIRMETTYYDTPDGSLSARRITLRLRRENGKSICCVKTPGSGNLHGEWETEWPEIEGGLKILCKLCDGADLASLTAGGVQPICGAAFTRQARLLTWGESTLELALDEGRLLGGDRTAALCELEIELKSGNSRDADALAKELAEKYGLQPERRSKFRRALALAKGE